MERAKTQQMVDMDAVQRAQAQQAVYDQPTQQRPVLVPAQPAAAMLPCPRCGELVPREAKYCSKCRLLLSPSESGMHLRPQAVSRPTVSNRPLTDQPTLLPPSAPPVPAMPAASIADQPTLEI